MIEGLMKQAQPIVDRIKKICPDVGKLAQEELDNFKPKLVCTGKLPTQKYKDETFKGIKDAVEMVRKACPKADKECDELIGLIEEGETVKCGP